MKSWDLDLDQYSLIKLESTLGFKPNSSLIRFQIIQNPIFLPSYDNFHEATIAERFTFRHISTHGSSILFYLSSSRRC